MAMSDATVSELIACLDVTSLSPTDHAGTVRALCTKVLGASVGGGRVRPAAVCVWPTLVHVAAVELAGSGVRAACVAGAFPTGQSPLSVRVNEVELAVRAGAAEVDIVIDRGRAASGDIVGLVADVRAMREAAGEATMKVIVESAELLALPDGAGLLERVCRSVMDVLREGDFVKTSTGFARTAGGGGASREAVEIMLRAIAASGRRLGLKVSGGVRTVSEASAFAALAWPVVERGAGRLRIGASGLFDALVAEAHGGVGRQGESDVPGKAY